MSKRILGLAAAAIVVAGAYYYYNEQQKTCCTQEPAPEATAGPGHMTAKEDAYNLAAQRAKIARIDMNTDTSFLSDEEKAVVNKLIVAANYMSDIYLRQRSEHNPEIRAEIASSSLPDKDLLLDMFDLHFGPWDTLDEAHPFYGDKEMPAGAAFYPEDMSKEEFNAWLEAHPEDREAFTSLYTVIRRDGDKLVAIPYREHYREWLEPAAQALREAAEITSNASLKDFLSKRAESFLTDEYFESEIAWMDLEGTPIEVAIGPYEVYTDGLFGYKAAYEAFITIKDPEESAAVARYKNYLRDMEANLPVDETYKNFKRGFASPIAATEQIHGGGDNVPGVQTIAFNLPNDERVREAKGAKKVLLNNVLEAKFKLILAPMAEHILVPAQAEKLMAKYMALETLFHELSHSLGPGTITKDGVETTVNAELKELYSAVEEGKADVMGVYNILFMMEKGELPKVERDNLLASYFVGIFRAMRFGTDEAHGKGAAFQYAKLQEAGAFTIDAESGLYTLDFDRLETSVTDIVRTVVILQGDGDYAAAKNFLDTYGKLDDAAKAAIKRTANIPVDVQPVYPEKL
ncbi:dipeptidyl-peptidase 3 family protein [Kordiimonas sp.]|uniref:dipeptidyl-peptidase 3 family protein n=1 Tax=Kordiimonas sp. TaxID=1970157 RepID=UPI003A906F9C